MWYSGMVESPFEASATGHAMAKGRSLSQFQEMFPDEASCAAFLLKRRWSGGFFCPRCGGPRLGGPEKRAPHKQNVHFGRAPPRPGGEAVQLAPTSRRACGA